MSQEVTIIEELVVKSEKERTWDPCKQHIDVHRTEEWSVCSVAVCDCQPCAPLWAVQRNCPKPEETETMLEVGLWSRPMTGGETEGRWQLGIHECCGLAAVTPSPQHDFPPS
jgi:hypothetical protein